MVVLIHLEPVERKYFSCKLLNVSNVNWDKTDFIQ